jgi:hypothetical protein
MTDGIIPWLFGFTLIAVLVFAVWQWFSTREARRHHDRSAMPPPDEHPTREPVDHARSQPPTEAPGPARREPSYERR